MLADHRNLSAEHIAALLEAARAINSTLDLEKVLQAVAESASKVMNAEACSVLMLDTRRNKLVFRAASGQVGHSLINQEFDADRGIAGKVATTGKAEAVLDVSQNPSFYPAIDEKSEFQTRALLCAPMRRKDSIIGVIEVINKIPDDVFSQQDMTLLEVFANLAAIGADNARQYEKLKLENQGFRESSLGNRQIIGQSQALQAALKMCQRVAASNSTVLLLGESGTGKELAARHIHTSSPRSDKPFIAVNCAALPESLLESELFGHEKGSFTGATSQKLGRFELADGGTLLLDEIGEITQPVQLRLLRVLQERQFVRVGGTKVISSDVRIVAATNRDLKQAVAEGAFREDVYYRLNVFPVELPALRERREDIPLLIDFYLEHYAKQLAMPQPKIADAAMAMMAAYHWPGNIRELQNVVERAVLLADDGMVGTEHLPREIIGDSQEQALPANDSGSLWDYERAMIVRALDQNNWNQTQAAKTLGISRDNLRYRLKKYDIRKQ